MFGSGTQIVDASSEIARSERSFPTADNNNFRPQRKEAQVRNIKRLEKLALLTSKRVLKTCWIKQWIVL